MGKQKKTVKISLRGSRRAVGGPKAMIARPVKILPNADHEFLMRARKISANITREREAFGVSDADAKFLSRRVNDYAKAYNIAKGGLSRNVSTIDDKVKLRKELEELLRMHLNIIRADPSVTTGLKKALGIHQRSGNVRPHGAPESRPVLEYLRRIEAGECNPQRHVLEFHDFASESKRRPVGVARLELAFELVRPEDRDNLPTHPAEYSGWPRILRSYSRRSPIEVDVPMPSEPMLVVYWARWANATGETGPWSDICVAGYEGRIRSSSALPTLPVRRAATSEGVQMQWVYIFPPPQQLPERLESDEAAMPPRKRVMNEKPQRMLEAKRVVKRERRPMLEAA